MIEESINQLMRHIIDFVISDDYAIKADQDGPRKKGPYATVKTNIPRTIGAAEIMLSNQADPALGIDRTIKTLREVSVSVNTFRDSAIDNAGKIANAFEREGVRELTRAANVGFVDSSAIRIMPKEVEGNNEERAQFDIRIHVEGTDSEVVTAIDSVTVNTEFQTAGNVYTDTIGVE